jgi:hypothetical protein
MKKILLFAAALAVGLVSCDKMGESSETLEFSSVEVSIPETFNLSWSNGDVVSAGLNNVSDALKNVPSGSKKAVFNFKKTISDGDLFRFPGLQNPSTLLIPAEQTSINGKFDASAAPMHGTFSLANQTGEFPSIELKGFVGLLKFAVKGTDVITKMKIEAVAKEYINGKFSMSKTGTLANATNASASTTITFKSPVALNEDKAVDLFIPVLAEYYSKGFSVKFYNDKGKLMRVTVFEKGHTLEAGSVKEFNLVYTSETQISLSPGQAFDESKLEVLPEDQLDYETYQVVGKIMYDDGQPAVGVKVSDGFKVVQTDSEGNYSFISKGLDVRYIYVSMPADARITVSDKACPDFYQTYNVDKHVYNFTLLRQPIETEFTLFALADPQTHYATRDTQKKADTDRFNDETVPAINREINKQTLPCYGISLGDITYSEGNRDSTPSMTIIRSHFGKINMPMFNVMGNHDYTFYKNNASISTNSTSSTINLLAQRNFEDVFGPINYSFDRGNVHFVCMKNIRYKSTTSWSWSDYECGFTNEEYAWLEQDLAMTPKSMKVILCVHIPISTNTGKQNVSKVQSLMKQFKDPMVFSGHTHYQRAVHEGNRLYEQIHAAACGQWWWSNIEGDGCPNGYTVYHFNGTDIKDSYFMGVNDGMNTRDHQMRIYKGDLKTGGKYAYFQSPYAPDGTYTYYLINVFNGNSKWTVKVYENGEYKGDATLLSVSSSNWSKVEAGKTYSPAFGSSQDWWSIGYHIGVCQRGTSSTSYYTTNYHMWCWASTNSSAKISVKAYDPHGNEYSCDQIITDGLNYPEYIKTPLNVK